MTESELIGPDPCVGCIALLIGECGHGRPEHARRQDRSFACGPYAAYQARKELVERLKGENFYCQSQGSLFVKRHDHGALDASYSLQQRHLNETGWLAWIGEDK